MNDYALCTNYERDKCPTSCFRAQITERARKRANESGELIICTFTCFYGTSECKLIQEDANGYIEREAALNSVCYDCSQSENNQFCGIACADYERIKAIPAADVRPVVLCRDCLHYEMGVCLKIYDDGAANKDAWQERKPDDYCSYGEDKNVPANCRTDMRPTSMSGANGEGKHENRFD